MDDSRVLVYDLEGTAWEVEPDPTMDVGMFARSLLMDGASVTAKLADGHFVVIPAHAIVRVEVMTAEAMIARFDSRSASRIAEELGKAAVKLEG
jgi:hypothetical protein